MSEGEGGGNGTAGGEVPWAEVRRYGVVGFMRSSAGVMAIDQMIEKPAREKAPSNSIMSGRYILQPEIFKKIAAVKPGAGGEIQLTDAMIALMTEQAFWGFKFEGETFDCGDKLGFLMANVAHGLVHAEIGPAFREALHKLMLSDHLAQKPASSIAA